MKLTRSGLADVLDQDFVRTARAKGLSPAVILRRHALRPALMPVVSYLGPAAAGLLTGAVVIETVFSLPGRSEEHTSELQSLMRISYAVFCLKKKKNKQKTRNTY